MHFRVPVRRLLIPTVLPVAALLAVVTAEAALPALASAEGVNSWSQMPEAPDDPTFYEDVLPLLQEHCQACHQRQGLNLGGMVAPMALQTYEDTRPWAPIIAEVVASGTMPPWHADPRHEGTFRGERFLQPDERETFISWARSGAPPGDPANAPPPSAHVRTLDQDEWWIGDPDLVLQVDFCLDDDVHDLYQTVVVDVTGEMMPEDRWIKAVEYRVGSAVHHILGGVGGLVPGQEPRIYDDGHGRLFQAGPRQLAFNMHYNKEPGPGTGHCPLTEVGIIFREEGEVIRYITRGEDLGITDFVIPAGDPAYSATREYAFEEDSYLLSFLPHMHLRGKAIEIELEYPDGGSEVVLSVPSYDFNWQHTYEFRDPPLIPAGTRLEMTLWWDNSADNPHNPDPGQDVRWGLPTYAEMGYGFMQYRPVAERHIVVGQEITDEVLRANDQSENEHPSADPHTGDP
jgi:hypothetical protein